MEEEKPKPGQPLDKSKVHKRPIAPSDKSELLKVLRDAGRGGGVEVTSHFKMRAAQRGFTTLDALNALRRGEILSGPEFCPEFCNWKFAVKFEHDDGDLIIVATVCAGEKAQVWSGNVMLVTGFIR